MNNVENAPVIDDQDNILIFKTTSEGTNFKVHFTIRAQKVHEHMTVYTGGAGTSTVMLSVSISTRGSSASKDSPTFFSHFDTVASVIDSPSVGTINSIDILI